MSRYLPTITWIFVAVLLISGIVSTKIIALGPLSFDGGTLLFPISYIFGDVLTEVYGYKKTRKIIWIWLISMVMMSLMIMIVGWLPSDPQRVFQTDYNNILALAPRIFIWSIVAYFVGEFLNSYILAKMKVAMGGKKLWMRTIGSTLVGEFFDTIIMITIAFWGLFPLATFVTIIVSNYIFKVLVEILFTPVTYKVVARLKHHEQIDVYDTHTQFTPFSLKE